MIDWLSVDYLGPEDKPMPRVFFYQPDSNVEIPAEQPWTAQEAGPEDLATIVAAIAVTGFQFTADRPDRGIDGYLVTPAVGNALYWAELGFGQRTREAFALASGHVTDAVRARLQTLASRLPPS